MVKILETDKSVIDQFEKIFHPTHFMFKNTVAKNPRTPGFNHFLFETIASLVKVAETDNSVIDQFEQFLFPHFQVFIFTYFEEGCVVL